MDGRAGHAPRRARCLHQASRSVAGSLRRACKVGLCFVLAVSLSLVPLDFKVVSAGDSKHSEKLGLEVQESEAHAIAPVVAGGAAVAAGLGISEEALIAALIGTFAIATGISASQWDAGAFSSMFDSAGNVVQDIGTNVTQFNDTAYDTMLPPGVKTWDELTNEEKAKFGTKANYARGAWLGLSVETELAVIQDGSLVPSPEPEDPNEKKKWQKGRNIITMLVAGAAVGVGEVANWFASSLGKSVKEFLFGPDSSFDLDLAYNESIAGIEVRWLNGTFNYYYSSGPVSGETYDQWVYYKETSAGAPRVWFDTNYTQSGQPQLITSWTATLNSARTIFTFPTVGTGVSYTYYNTDGSFATSGTQALRPSGSGTVTWPSKSSDETLRFNANWRGSYVFANIGTMSNGVWTGEELEKTNVDYDYLPEIPPQLPGTVISSPTTYNNWFNNYQIEPEGSQRTAILPGYISNPENQPGDVYEPEYMDFIQETPDSEVEPVPDTEPYVPKDPSNPDVPTPDPNWDFQTELNDAVTKLGTEGFGTLFPFCLVVDIQRLVEKVNSNMTSSGTSTIRIPLTDFEIPGTSDMDLNLAWLLSLGGLARPWWTVLIAGVLIAESVRYFLK